MPFNENEYEKEKGCWVGKDWVHVGRVRCRERRENGIRLWMVNAWVVEEAS